MSRVLLVRPVSDAETTITHQWGQEIYDVARRLGHDVAEGRNRREVEGHLPQADCAILLGHGSDDRFQGQDGQAALDLANVALTRGKIVFVVACYTSNRLGQEAMGVPARAYIGYTASFWVWADQFTPERQVANNWIRAANVQLATALLEGRSCNFAVAQARETYTEAYHFFEAAAGDGVLDADVIASTMLRNRNTLVLSAGDLYARVL